MMSPNGPVKPSQTRTEIARRSAPSLNRNPVSVRICSRKDALACFTARSMRSEASLGMRGLTICDAGELASCATPSKVCCRVAAMGLFRHGLSLQLANNEDRHENCLHQIKQEWPVGIHLQVWFDVMRRRVADNVKHSQDSPLALRTGGGLFKVR